MNKTADGLCQVAFEIEDDSILENKGGKIEWYDLIKCRLKEYNNIPALYIPGLYIPAAYLKIKGLLPNIDLGDEKQFRFDFNNFRKNGKTINEAGSFINKEKKMENQKMLAYVRHLYKQKSGAKNDYGKEIDQAKRQFIAEFKKFTNIVFKEEDIQKNIRKTTQMAELLKMFILYKSVKITNIPYPLDAEREFLPDEADVSGIDDMFMEGKDNISVAPLDGELHSPNEIFIQKLYALLWVNSDISDVEVKMILGYIGLLEKITYILSNAFWNKNMLNSIMSRYKNDIIEENRYNFMSETILQEFNAFKAMQISDLKEYLLSHSIKISLFGYFIIKIYISNKLKLFARIKIANEITKRLSIKYPDVQQLKEIRAMVENIKIESKADFVNLFNNKTSCISDVCQKKILDMIFPEKKKKSKKREIIENNFEGIFYIYLQFVCSRLQANEEVKFLNSYNLIIASYLYFKLKSVVITKSKTKTFTATCFDDRCKAIGSLLKQIKQTQKEAWRTFYYYSQISNSIETQYHTLFNTSPALNNDTCNEFRKKVNDTLAEVWQDGLNEIYRFDTI